MAKKAQQTVTPRPAIDVTLKFEELHPDKIIGFHMDWLTGNVDKKYFELKTNAGMGGSAIFFNYQGKRYKADVKDLIQQLITNIEKK